MIGTQAGSYKITDLVDVGGMGSIYRAEHTIIGRVAAVKILHPQVAADLDIVNRFFNEARAMTSIKHPGIVEVYDFGYLESGHAYLVMEFLDGVPLSTRNLDRGPIPEGEAAAILKGVCSALAASHAKGVVHRDLKPDNIFMVPDPDTSLGARPKLLDFGIAKFTEIGLAGSGTMVGAVMGTPSYMSPEQCRGTGEVDHRADLYSLGCMFYEMVAGRPPFVEKGAGELIAAHLFVDPEQPSHYAAGISPETEALIMSLLAKQPAERPQTATELGHRLSLIAQRTGWGSSASWDQRSTLAMQASSIARDTADVTPSPSVMPSPRITPSPKVMPAPTVTPSPNVTPAPNAMPANLLHDNTLLAPYALTATSAVQASQRERPRSTTLSGAVTSHSISTLPKSGRRIGPAVALAAILGGGIALVAVFGGGKTSDDHAATAPRPAPAAPISPEPLMIEPPRPEPVPAATPAPTLETAPDPAATPESVVTPEKAAEPVATPDQTADTKTATKKPTKRTATKKSTTRKNAATSTTPPPTPPTPTRSSARDRPVKRQVLALALVSISASLVYAQPAPPPSGDKVDAKALLSSGLKLYAAKDYLGALAVFKDAYMRFPSSKILLNIGTALKALGRNAEAANTYQRYIDATDIEPTKKTEVTKALAQLDAKLGMLEITVTPADAEIRIDNGEWLAAKDAAHVRIDPGSAVVHARRADYSPSESTVEVAAGAHQTVALVLTPVPVAATSPGATSRTPTVINGAASGGGISISVEPAQPPSKLGLIAYAHVDFKFQGAAGFVGASFEVLSRLQVEAAAILGPKYGGYLGARYAFLDGWLRPTIAAGVPIFVSDGARVGVRGAGGVELAVHRKLSFVAELGVEHMFNPEANIAATLLVPAVGAIGRL